MIPTDLQDELEKRMKALFTNTQFKNPDNEYIPLNIFKQHLPEKKSNDISLYPYLIIKLVEGEQRNENDLQQAQVVFVAGVFDDTNNYQGYRDVSSIIQKIYENLKRQPLVGNTFELQYPIRWALHDEDVYPYYFGGLETNWGVPTALREDVEALI
jgi:hypothetical protein